MTQFDRLVITIDGAAGTGKSSVAHELATRLQVEYLDSGAMYRAVAVLSVQNDIDPTDAETLANAVRETRVYFDWTASPPTIMLGDQDVSVRIRDLEISGVVSFVAKEPKIREVLMEQQRKIVDEHPRIVTEGRDQGSIVFPDATVHFFLTANMEERTRRRVKQLQESGQSVEEAQVTADIKHRDHLDSTRKDGPLVCPDGAIVIDTSDRVMEEVVALMEEAVNLQLNA